MWLKSLTFEARDRHYVYSLVFYLFILQIFLSPFILSQNQSVQCIDNFEHFPTNCLGGDFSTGGPVFTEVVTNNSAFEGKTLALHYDVSVTDTFAFYSTDLGGIDFSDYKYLSFWIRGVSGQEYLRIQLKNATLQASVSVWDYLTKGPNTNWQKVVIPLDAFYNLTSLTFLTELVVVFENFQSTTNGSPVVGEVWIDDIVVGTYFPGYIKIDHFDDLLNTNATGGNNGEFSEPPSPTSYTSTINCDTYNVNPCALEFHYNNIGTSVFGGEYFILGGGSTGWDPVYQNLSAYDSLHLTIKAEADSSNPGNFKVELKSPSQTHFKRIFDITTDFNDFSIGFNEFSPPLGSSPQIGQITLVFERNVQEKQSGVIFLDEIEFRNGIYSGVDTTSPSKPTNWLYNGSGIPHSIEIMDNDELSVTFTDFNPRLESVRLEYRGDNESIWHVYDYDSVFRKYVNNNNIFSWILTRANLPENDMLDFRAIAQNYNGKEDTSDVIYLKTTPLNFTLTDLFRQSYEVFRLQRNDKGIYRDALRFDGNHFHPASVANIGMGLISLCIADSMGWITDASQLAEITLASITGNNLNYNPDRNATGFYRHFIDMEDGSRAWDSEYSSIDTGILVSGALFCKKYFSSNSTIASFADQLWTTIDWSKAIADPQTGKIYREFNEDGLGDTLKTTQPFNEYIIVAWLAYLAEQVDQISGPATELWNKFYADPISNDVPKSYYEGIELLTDYEGSFLPHFTLQFPYYLCQYFTTNASYIEYMSNARTADSLWWAMMGVGQTYEWGLGAGSANFGFGYHADAIDNNPTLIFSPHIISGFIPVYDEGKNDLLKLLQDGKAVYGLPPASPDKILWRQSLADQYWQAEDIQGVDFSTMLFGLAYLPEHLGSEFFSIYNDFMSILVSIDKNIDKPISRFILYQNYPNPFNPNTRIRFNLPEPNLVTLIIYNISGEKVVTLLNQKMISGSHFVDWFGEDQFGEKVSSGFYFYQLQSDHKVLETKRMLLLK